MEVVVDSGVFIRWEREGRGIDFSQWMLLGEPFVSVMTVSELKVGIHRANTSSDEKNEASLLPRYFHVFRCLTSIRR